MSASADCSLVCVDPKRIYEVWPHVDHLLNPAMQRTGELLSAGMLRNLAAARFLLWLIWDGERIAGAVVTELADTTQGRVCVIVAIGGRDRHRWLHLLDELEGYAAREGCRAMRIYGRKGWKRVLPDYRETRVILEKELN